MGKKAKTKKKHEHAGRPRKYPTPEKMQEAIDKYFNSCHKKPTMCGLALAIGFNNRCSLWDYGGYGAEFPDTIKNARTKVENYYESQLSKSKFPAAGSIFALKNMGWKDQQQVEHGMTDGFAQCLKEMGASGKGLPIKG